METFNPLHIDVRNNKLLTSYEEDVLKSVGATSKLKFELTEPLNVRRPGQNFK